MASANQDRLRSKFASSTAPDHGSVWDALWEEKTFLPWDRGNACPALIDLLAVQSQATSTTSPSPPTSQTPNPTPASPQPTSTPGNTTLPPALREDGSRRRVLVPGCGAGYDVALFAAHGYDAVGLEISRHAAEVARAYVEGARGSDKGPLEGEYEAAVGKSGGWGSVKIVEGDYFDDAWVGGAGGEGGFDVIYDITFLCALPPELRSKWALRTVSLLKQSPDSRLICLEFPTHKPASSGGPPWSLPPTVHAELLKRPGDEITYDDQGVVVATERPEAENALVRVAHYTPQRSHGVGLVNGVVRDGVSIWRHKSVGP
ncbi:S-adenosyl-L-methionine-dependent methyltransferase [Pyrenochaeta sp. DS3sAY3a]|nr:S-adenosyl-L-methionine-dependent methyltransferase [Pyrenochaeta sp. DS3sAY3a]